MRRPTLPGRLNFSPRRSSAVPVLTEIKQSTGRGAAWCSTAGVAWDAIALHTTPEIPRHKRPEIAPVTGGVEADVLGDGLDEIPVGDRDAVLAAHPRIDFKRGIVQAFADGFAHEPATTFGTMNTDALERTLPGYRWPNFCDLIAANPLGG